MGEFSFGSGISLEDTLFFFFSFLKAFVEASGDFRYVSGEDDFWVFKKSKFDCDFFAWSSFGEFGF